MGSLKRFALPIRLAVLIALMAYVGLVSRDTWNRISWDFFWQSPLVAMSLIAVGLNVLLPAGKYTWLYRRCGIPIAYRTALILEFATSSMSMLMPGKTENFVRAAVLGKRFGVPWRHSLVVSAYHLYTSIVALLAAVMAWAGATKVFSPATSGALTVAVLASSMAPVWIARRMTWGGLDLLRRLGVVDHIFALLLSFALVASTPIFVLMIFAAHLIKATSADVIFRSLLLDLLSQLPASIGGIGLRETGALLLFRNFAPASVLAATGLMVTLFEKLFAAALGMPFAWGVLRATGTGTHPVLSAQGDADGVSASERLREKR